MTEMIITSNGWKEESEVDKSLFIASSKCINCGRKYKGTVGGIANSIPTCYNCSKSRRKIDTERGVGL